VLGESPLSELIPLVPPELVRLPSADASVLVPLRWPFVGASNSPQVLDQAPLVLDQAPLSA
jgi:hypothetical protein